jgi:hypothetical protein
MYDEVVPLLLYWTLFALNMDFLAQGTARKFADTLVNNRVASNRMTKFSYIRNRSAYR